TPPSPGTPYYVLFTDNYRGAVGVEEQWTGPSINIPSFPYTSVNVVAYDWTNYRLTGLSQTISIVGGTPTPTPTRTVTLTTTVTNTPTNTATATATPSVSLAVSSAQPMAGSPETFTVSGTDQTPGTYSLQITSTVGVYSMSWAEAAGLHAPHALTWTSSSTPGQYAISVRDPLGNTVATTTLQTVASLSMSPTVAKQGDTVQIVTTAVAPPSGSSYSVVFVGADPAALGWAWTGSNPSYAVPASAPVGTYPVQLWNGNQLIAAGGQVTIISSTPPAGYSVAALYPTVAEGQPITVNVSGPPLPSGDAAYVKIVQQTAAGAPGFTAQASWSGQTSVTLTAPRSATYSSADGTYTVELVDSYYVLATASQAVQVNPWYAFYLNSLPPAFLFYIGGNAGVTSYAPVPPAGAPDTIEFVATGQPPAATEPWSGESQVVIPPSLTINQGSYNVFLALPTGQLIGGGNSINVSVAPTPTAVPYSVTVSPTLVALGGSFTFSSSAPAPASGTQDAILLRYTGTTNDWANVCNCDLWWTGGTQTVTVANQGLQGTFDVVLWDYSVAAAVGSGAQLVIAPPTPVPDSISFSPASIPGGQPVTLNIVAPTPPSGYYDLIHLQSSTNGVTTTWRGENPYTLQEGPFFAGSYVVTLTDDMSTTVFATASSPLVVTSDATPTPAPTATPKPQPPPAATATPVPGCDPSVCGAGGDAFGGFCLGPDGVTLVVCSPAQKTATAQAQATATAQAPWCNPNVLPGDNGDGTVDFTVIVTANDTIDSVDYDVSWRSVNPPNPPINFADTGASGQGGSTWALDFVDEPMPAASYNVNFSGTAYLHSLGSCNFGVDKPIIVLSPGLNQ
ncbi:MAG TPA: hypothetical protein VKU60_07840, partial [Chloroflexota bacterium]|nr:hypothetical protein [Chloroflexota bacterium]